MGKKQKITIASRKDFDISYFVGSGPGGQNKQKNCTGVQILHRESGAIGRCSETRSQDQNKRAALQKLTETPKFKFWLNKKLYFIQNHKTIEESVEEELQPENLIIEVKDDKGRWTKWIPDESIYSDISDAIAHISQ